MSTNHGETVMQEPIGEYAKYIKNLIPANIPEIYALKPMFENVANEENIRKGVVAFRDFLYLFCDRLISDGHLYCTPQKTKNPTDYSFLHNINDLLIDFGYHGILSDNGNSLLLSEIPSFNAPKRKIPVSKQMECLRFLTLCGFVFTGINLNTDKFNITEKFFNISYPNNPILLTGLRALSVASIQLQVRFLNNAHNLLRCDYRVMKAEDTNITDVLKDFLYPLPENLQKFALELHYRYIDLGMTCATLDDNAVHFFYSYQKTASGFYPHGICISKEYGNFIYL